MQAGASQTLKIFNAKHVETKNHLLVNLQAEAPPAVDADADAAADPAAEPDAVEAVPPECFPGGVPSPWRVKDVGPATAEQLRRGLVGIFGVV